MKGYKQPLEHSGLPQQIEIPNLIMRDDLQRGEIDNNWALAQPYIQIMPNNVKKSLPPIPWNHS